MGVIEEKLKVQGVGRAAKDGKMIVVFFNREPTNEELTDFDLCIRAVPDWHAVAEEILSMQEPRTAEPGRCFICQGEPCLTPSECKP